MMAKILVIDDEKLIRDRLTRLLEIDDYETFSADNGRKGLEVFDKEKPDIALVDINMPGMDGIEVLRKIKEESEETEVIIVTGHGGIDSAIDAMKEGALSYIQKPIEFDELEIEIKRALEKQEMRRKLNKYVHDLEEAVREKTKELTLRKQAEKEIRRLNAELEQRVIERTAQLEETNKELRSEIAERKRAEEALRDSEERLQSLFKTMAEGVVLSASDGQIVQANHAAERILGFKRLENRSYVGPEWELLRPDGTSMPPEEMAGIRAMEEKRPVKGIVMGVKRPDDFISWLNVNAMPLVNETRGFEGVVATFTDITTHRNTQEALRKAYAQNEQLLAAISSILIGVDENDRITMWNTTAERVFGTTKADAVGRPFRECGIQWEWNRVIDSILACCKNNQPTHVDDIRFTRPDGTEGLLGMTLSPIDSKDGECPGFLLLGADITERRILQEQLRQAQKLESIGQLAAGIAHEINTPTQYVGDNTRFLQESLTDILNLLEKYHTILEANKAGTVPSELIDEMEDALDEADIEFLSEEIPLAIEQSLQGINSVANIVQAMKEFSHPGMEEKTSYDINRAIENTIMVARNEWKYIAEMETSFDTDLPLIPCLQGEFNQVILNILINAAQAIADVVEDGSERKGKIAISTHRNGDWAEIRISDTGMGIPEEIRSKIFDPFFTTKDVGKGTGQGLAISHNVVVEKHGGTITFETEMGKGTAFIIRLPISEVAEGK